MDSDRANQNPINHPSPEFEDEHTNASAEFQRTLTQITIQNVKHSESGQIVGLCLALYAFSNLVSEMTAGPGFYKGGASSFWESTIQFCLLAAAINCIISKSNPKGLFILSGVLIVRCLFNMPHTPDHAILELIIFPLVIAGITYANYNYPLSHFQFISDLLKFGAPTLLFVLCLVRLNAGYYDNNFSCTANYAGAFGEYFNSKLGPKILPTSITGLLGISFLLTLFERKSSWGLLLGILAFGIIGIDQKNYAFMGIALLFSSYSTMHTSIKFFTGRTEETDSYKELTLTLIFSIVGAILAFLTIRRLLPLAPELLTNVAYFLSITGLFTLGIFGHFTKDTSAQFSLFPMLILPILILFIAAKPFLGIANYHSLSAHSNLHVSPGKTNHLLIPAFKKPFSKSLSHQYKITRTQDERFFNINKSPKAKKFSKLEYIRTPNQPKDLPIEYRFNKYFIFNHLTDRAQTYNIAPYTEFQTIDQKSKIVVSKYDALPRYKFGYKFLFSRPIPQNVIGLCYK